MRRFVSFFALAISLIVSLCAASVSQVPSTFFTVSTASVFDLPKVPYGTLGHPGVMAWSAIETSRGVFNFKQIDGFVLHAPQLNGVAQIVLDLAYTPGWAVADQSSCRTLGKNIGCTQPPDNLQDWSDFLNALIAHYNGIAAPHVAYFEVWCEANNPQFWTGTLAQLAQMGTLAYPILKSDANSQVLTPSVIWSVNGVRGYTFLQNYLALAPADGVTFHAYTCRTNKLTSGGCAMPESNLSTNAPLQKMIPSFQAIANGLPLLVTEGSWGIHGVTDPDLQQAWLAHYLILGASYATSANLEMLTWFEWGVPTIAFSGDIENADGTPNLAGQAYGVVQGWLNAPMTPCSVSGSIWSCPVGANLIVWDSSQSCANGVCTTSAYTVSGFANCYDLSGVEWPVANGTIQLGVKPVLLVP